MERQKLTVNLSAEIADSLRKLAEDRNTTLTEILRQAISTEKFLVSEVNKGGTVLIKEKNGNYKQLVFR